MAKRLWCLRAGLVMAMAGMLVATGLVVASPPPADAACSTLVGCGSVTASATHSRRVRLKPKAGHCVRVETKSAASNIWYDHGVHWCGSYYRSWTISTPYDIAAVRIRKNRTGPTLWIGS